jgi:hypothetical protein
MTTRRFIGTCAAAFVIAQIMAIAIHGFILRADYLPSYGTLLRPMDGDAQWQMLLLPLSHLSFVVALVWIYSRISLGGSRVVQGLALGVIGFLVGQAPLWLLWYAEQPWPGTLVAKQLVLELAASLVLGLVVVATSGKSRVDVARRSEVGGRSPQPF